MLQTHRENSVLVLYIYKLFRLYDKLHNFLMQLAISFSLLYIRFGDRSPSSLNVWKFGITKFNMSTVNKIEAKKTKQIN